MIVLPLTMPSKYVGSAVVSPVTVRWPVVLAPLCLRSTRTSPEPIDGFRNTQVPAHFPLTSTLGGAVLLPVAAHPESISTSAPLNSLSPFLICSPFSQRLHARSVRWS